MLNPKTDGPFRICTTDQRSGSDSGCRFAYIRQRFHSKWTQIWQLLCYQNKHTNKQTNKQTGKTRQQRESVQVRQSSVSCCSLGGARSVCTTWHPWQPAWVSTETERGRRGVGERGEPVREALACCWYGKGHSERHAGFRGSRWKRTPIQHLINRSASYKTRTISFNLLRWNVRITQNRAARRERCCSPSGECRSN